MCVEKLIGAGWVAGAGACAVNSAAIVATHKRGTLDKRTRRRMRRILAQLEG